MVFKHFNASSIKHVELVKIREPVIRPKPLKLKLFIIALVVVLESNEKASYCNKNKNS